MRVPLRVGSCGYMFITDAAGAEWLLDTGCPRSFSSSSGPLVLDDHHTFPTEGSCMCVCVAQVRQYLRGSPFVGIVGMDALRHFDAVVDVRGGVMQLLPPGGFVGGAAAIALRTHTLCGGLPAVHCHVEGGESGLMVVDTGATLTFLHPSVFTAEERAQPSVHSDFHCLTGTFTSFVAPRDITLAPGLTLTAERCGCVPPALQQLLDLKGIMGILGNALFASHVVAISAATEQITIVAASCPADSDATVEPGVGADP